MDSPEKGRTHIGSRPVKVIRRVGGGGRGRGRAGQLLGGGGGRGGPRWGCGVLASRLYGSLEGVGGLKTNEAYHSKADALLIPKTYFFLIYLRPFLEMFVL